MLRYIAKLILAISAFILSIDGESALLIIIPFLIALILSSLISILPFKYTCHAVVAAATVCCFISPEFCIYLPLLVFDLDLKSAPSIPIYAIALLSNIASASAIATLQFIMLFSLSLLISYMVNTLHAKNRECHVIADKSKEEQLKFNYLYSELRSSQLGEIEISKLAERNKIACEIHDNVGHILSSSILQTGALIATIKDENIKQSLTLLKNNLQTAMTNIRESVHSIHTDLFDLEKEMHKLTDSFTFCPITLSYGIKSTIKNRISAHILAIVKEALTNVIKHSNATRVTVELSEFPAFYKLVIQDNGSASAKMTAGEHMGLKSIESRVNQIGGVLNITSTDGFRIFISIKKEQS